MKSCFLVLFAVLTYQASCAEQDSTKIRRKIIKAGLYVGTNYTIPQSTSINDPSYQITGKPAIGYEIGGRTTIRFSPFISLVTGISYSQIQYSTNIYGGNQYYGGNPYILNESSTYYSMIVPLTIKVCLHSGKWGYYAGVGGEFSMFFKYLDQGQVSINSKVSPVSNIDNNRVVPDYYLRPGMIAGVSYKGGKKIEYFTEAELTQYKFGEGYFQNLYTISVQAGVMFNSL
ncbi:MAG: hypothetical protein ACHQRM_14095 [Bacteroidia bacterium]